jgi:hypothetical protein
VKPPEFTYAELPCSDEQKACIYEIISTMAEKSKLSLFINQSHLKGLGDQISDVHPLKFLSVIFSDPYLKSCMVVIWPDYFKRSEFLEGLGSSFDRETEKGKLYLHKVDFAKDLGVNPDRIQSYFDARDWENLVLYLIQS